MSLTSVLITVTTPTSGEELFIAAEGINTSLPSRKSSSDAPFATVDVTVAENLSPSRELMPNVSSVKKPRRAIKTSPSCARLSASDKTTEEETGPSPGTIG